MAVPTTYPEYYNYLADQLLFKEYTRYFATPTAGYSCNPCFSITIDNTDFKNFNSLKPAISTPVAVDPAKGMLYTGHILDLDNFQGPIKVTNSRFQNIGIKYASCSVATTMLTTDPSTLADSYPSYGPKSKYQIKSVISIVNQ